MEPLDHSVRNNGVQVRDHHIIGNGLNPHLVKRLAVLVDNQGGDVILGEELNQIVTFTKSKKDVAVNFLWDQSKEGEVESTMNGAQVSAINYYVSSQGSNYIDIQNISPNLTQMLGENQMYSVAVAPGPLMVGDKVFYCK